MKSPKNDVLDLENGSPDRNIKKKKVYAVFNLNGCNPASFQHPLDDDCLDYSQKSKDSNCSRTSKNSGFGMSDHSGSYLVSVDSDTIDQLAESMNTNEPIHNDDLGIRNADLCCGFCCDLARACVIVDIVDICLTIMLILLSVMGSAFDQTFVDTIDFTVYEQFDDYLDTLDDDDYITNQARLRKTVHFLTIMLGCGIFFSLMGIVGALTFRRNLVLCTAIWYCIDFLRSALTLQWANTVVVGCFAYPHFALYMALRNQKITQENYGTEKHCCCPRLLC